MTERTKTRGQRGFAAKAIINLVAGLLLIGLGITVLSDPKFSPQLLQGIDFNLGKTVTMIGVVLVLFPVISSLYLTPLKAAIDERNNSLEKTFSEAEDLRSEMTKMKSDYEQRLIATEADARSQIQAQIKEAQNLRQTLMGEAAAKADELVKKATEEIEAEKNRVLIDIRIHVVDLTLKATEKVLGENMDSDKNRRLIAEFIDKVEVAH